MRPKSLVGLYGGWRRLTCLLVSLAIWGQAGSGPFDPNPALEQKIANVFQNLPPLQVRATGPGVASLQGTVRERSEYLQFLREKIADQWFAALVPTDPSQPFAVHNRFATWKSFTDFLLEREALVELWAYSAGGAEQARRIPAEEVSKLRRERFEQPLFATVTYRDPQTGQVTKYRVEFGFGAATHALASQRAYVRQRDIQEVARLILSCRDANGQLNAGAQWELLSQAARDGRFPVNEVPPKPTDPGDLFVAAEYSVGDAGFLSQPVRLWREREIKHRVVKDGPGKYVQVLILQKIGESTERDVRAFRVHGAGDELEPVPAPVPGQDSVELRIREPFGPDPRKWNVLEFGEPEALREASLARFSLINAYLEKRRKEVALRKSNLDLIAEPVFAGLNIGCGLAGVPFPVGAAARLGYNALVTPWFIPPVPSAKQMRELFRLMTAREKDPALKTRETCYLNQDDLEKLREGAKHLTDADVAQYLSRIGDEDVRGMLYLAKMQFFDAEFTNLLNIMAGAGKVSGWTDEPGLQQDIFNSIYFSVNGDISIKNIIAVLCGGEIATPLNGYSLEELSQGHGPAVAWLQYLDFTVDFRAVANTIARILTPDPADRELAMPFPYATRMTDPAAYEIRVFGFPTLMFFKRGLMKKDYAAYTNDFAYGLITTKIVEHFASSEEMDAEIRAGRMVPLGYVRVPGIKNGWKETNLAVFAHRIARGKYKGKTSIVIYGLKAYQEHSDLVEREYRRLKRLEQAFADGGVIEQVVDAEDKERLPSKELEPVIESGEEAVIERFTRPLGQLLENRRFIRLGTWGVRMSPTDLEAREHLRVALSSTGIPAAGEEDPLLEFDRYDSSFLYRKVLDGQWRNVKVVRIPGKAEMLRQLLKAEEAQKIEMLRQQAISPEGGGIVLLNSVRTVNGRVEVGPLLQEDGNVVGVGVLSGADAINNIFAQVSQLPVAHQARLLHRRFGATLMDLDPHRHGKPEPMFVTMEFPLGKDTRQITTNSLSGEREVLTIKDGQLASIVTARRVVELGYDERGLEVSSKTWRNSGLEETPQKGALLEETRTSDVWLREYAEQLPDPHEPRLAKVKANHVTGALSWEIYGLFRLPVLCSDDVQVVSNRFDEFGRFVSASAFENGRADADFARGFADAMLHPVWGEPKYEMTAEQKPETGGFLAAVSRRDLLKGITKTQSFDNANFGRQVSESWTEDLGGAVVSFGTEFEYHDDFLQGTQPWRTTRKSGAGVPLLRTTTLQYDPVLRRSIALEENLVTGASRTNAWDYRWDVPVRTESARRITTVEPDRRGTAFVSSTTSRSNGEELSTSRGTYDRESRTWTVRLVHWFRPAITNRVETERRTAFGTLLATRTGNSFETRPGYSSNAIEQSSTVFRQNTNTGSFDIPHRVEDEFAWKDGGREARVRSFLGGQPYDVFRTVTDGEGRLLSTTRLYSGLELISTNIHDGDSDRLIRSWDLQNGQIRVARSAGSEYQDGSGQWQVPVVSTPAWGLISTQVFLVGNILARPASTTLENGDTVHVRQWFSDSPVPYVTEVLNRHGLAKERYVMHPNSGTTDGLPCDSVTRQEITFWGQSAIAAEETMVRGTEIALFSEAADERTFYDLAQPFRAPRVITDPHALSGIGLLVGGVLHSNVLAVCRAHQESTSPGPVLVVEKADVRGLFSSSILEQKYDRAGRLLEESISQCSNLRGGRMTMEGVFGAERTMLARFTPEYLPGWFTEEPDPAAGRVLRWGTNPPAAGTRGYSVNDGSFRDIATETKGQIFARGDLAPLQQSLSMPRVLGQPRFLERNPYLPGRTDAWVEWTIVDFGTDGRPLVERNTIFDAQGRANVQFAAKRTSSGKPARRIAYFAAPLPPEVLKTYDLPAGQATVKLDIAGQSDFSGNDFIGLYSSSALEGVLRVSDTSGRTATVGHGRSDFKKGRVVPWPAGVGHVRWVPDDAKPLLGTELDAPEWLIKGGLFLPVSVHDLQRAGLDVSRLKSFELVVSNSAPVRVQVSGVQLFNRQGPFVPDLDPREYYMSEFGHSSGFRTTARFEQGATDRDTYTGHTMDALVTYNRVPVATARAHAALAKFPHVLWLDNSDFEVARPLYAVSDLDGRFLEHYSTFRLEDALVQVTPSAFEAPRLEVHRAGILEDELYPGRVYFGQDRQLRVLPSRGRGYAGEVAANVRQRVEANGFRVAGERLLGGVGPSPRGGLEREFPNLPPIKAPSAMAGQIRLAPTAAEALLSARDLPWGSRTSENSAAPTVNWRRLGIRGLSREHLAYLPTGLIATSPGTDAERYVDTVAEADLIALAATLQPYVADDILRFYWDISHGGQRPLLSSYDAGFGTGRKADVLNLRPCKAEATAEAQLAIAEVAFRLGFQNNNSSWLTFGSNLLHGVLEEHRSASHTVGAPRGIAEFEVRKVRHVLGYKFWPEANVYALHSNARAYLLLKHILPNIEQRSQDEGWKRSVAHALEEQESFLRTHVLPEVERTGVVPTGLFEMQDLAGESGVLAVERCTSTDDWLLFLEAAAEMGVPLETCRTWLENLARVHGVEVDGVWGLDWRLATLREDAISPALTARFARLARLLGHKQAEAFADYNLAAMQRGDKFPVVLTKAAPTFVLSASHDFSIRPATNHAQWPHSFAAFWPLRERDNPAWRLPANAAPIETWREPRTDLTVFILIAAGVYLSVLGSALFWWAFRSTRRKRGGMAVAETIVPEKVMALAEERWAKRVMGLRNPAGAEHWRYSNAPVEQNFLSQLRAIYKLVLEWRRLECNWSEDDSRLVQDANDEWLNGADEFAVLAGLYMRTVIKAGAKDGFPREDVLAENEDSNHIWARLAFFFSEHLWSLAAAVRGWQRSRGGPEESDFREEILHSLRSMGMRERLFGFDARELFDCPANPAAFDLLVVQSPTMTLRSVMESAAAKLDIPLEHITHFIRQYKDFKKREKPFPVHPYLLEFAKELPHFALMLLGAVIWYNQGIGDNPIVPYLQSEAGRLGISARSLLWAVPLLGGLLSAVLTHFLRIYRHSAAIQRQTAETFLDRSVTSLFVKTHQADPKERTGRWRDPDIYERCGWVLRALGFSLLSWELFNLDTPSFGTFLIVKGLFAMIALAEVAGVVLPLHANAISMFLQDWVTRHPATPSWVHFFNKLNITASRPTSPLWLSIKYHAQPSMPTGKPMGLAQAVVFYFVLAAAFFFGAGYLCQQIFDLWFTDTYLQAADWKLVVGGIVFTVTMILLRYGLFLLFTSVASFIAAFPVYALAGTLASAQVLFVFIAPRLGLDAASFLPTGWFVAALAMVLALAAKPIQSWRTRRRASIAARSDRLAQERLEAIKGSADVKLGVVYMSGDDLSALKLNPDLLMTRWQILRDKLESQTVPLLARLAEMPDDDTVRRWFQELYTAETKAGVTLWHPIQLRLESAAVASGLGAELGLNISVADETQRERLLIAWHIRRWLASMMSTAGHSQDTAINLVDIALRLEREGLSRNAVFYLIQNKYDNNTNNRPSQTGYDKGELDHRNKLARLLCAVAPGATAWCLQDWTPFGFKSGGLSGMDLVYEESLRLNTLVLLDRNATVHDLDALMLDLREALTDPNVIIVVPGRGTTNTLTPLGQASQLVEEGHRSFLRGLMSYLGGSASESVGTGWGNILACFYGRVQRSLLSTGGRKMPVTSRMKRGTTFADRTEGLIGFGPHAVGISEDIWAVVQTMNNALGLGYRPRFALSRAFWHKIRETWSHGEWLASFPRWAGGYLQMANDPLMQRINDLGPQPVFSRDIRGSAGRNFMAAPLALANILLMPLAIIFDVSPFVQMLFILWNCGFVLNQVLTLHALNTYLENCGFHVLTAVIGAGASALGCYLAPAYAPFAPGLMALGFLTGGFFVGISRWISSRLRDLILFGPQLVMQTMAHTVRLSLEFIVSGTSAEDAKSVNMPFRAWAGPREDRPLEEYPNFINLRTVTWGVGLFSSVLCVFALTNLDMLNVLLLLPSLLFSVSTLAGPFLMTPARGRPIGPWALLPRLAGWGLAGGFYVLVSLFLYAGGWHRWAGLALLVAVFAVVLSRALRYLPFRRRVKRCREQLISLLLAAGVKPAKVEGYAGQLMQLCANDPAKIAPELQRVGMAHEAQAPIVQLATEKIGPILRAPVLDMGKGLLTRSRWAIELSRAFILALLSLFWFFLVPVPAIIVFVAGKYRFTLSLEKVLAGICWAVAIAIVADLISRVIMRLQAGSLGKRGLACRFKQCLGRVKQLPARLSQYEIASAFALLTDTQTYLDQHSYAYAERSLSQVEQVLGSRATTTREPSRPGSEPPPPAT